MNAIEAILGTTQFLPAPHLLIAVDGQPLDQLLSNAHPDKSLNGLIPTTLDWLENTDEQAVVWERFTELSLDCLVVPILCCPDDLDFSCSVVVVDAKFESDVVSWIRFGLDTTPIHRLPTAIGSSVEWLSGVGPFTFTRTAYHSMVEEFTSLRTQAG